jgi:hypothetical protein
MATPNQSETKCPNCGKTNFEITKDFPSDSLVTMNYLRCSSCKTFLYAFPILPTNSKQVELLGAVSKIQSEITLLKKHLKV